MIKNLQFLFGVKETVYEFWLGPGQQEEKRKGQGCEQEQAADMKLTVERDEAIALLENSYSDEGNYTL